MKNLPWQDLHHLRAAEGWLGLGDWWEASKEIEGIFSELREHPSVLRVRLAICDAARHWELAVEVATTLTKLTPEDPGAWLHRSFALHELKRTEEARDSLASVVFRFPDFALMRYNLACYEAQLGSLTRAINWLQQAFDLPTGAQLRTEALADPDLRALWPQIETLNQTGA